MPRVRTAVFATATAAVAVAVGLLTVSASPPDAGAGGPADAPERVAQASRAELVERQVARLNRVERARTAAHAVDGWELVDTEPPDPAVVALDPALLSDREEELRVQLASVSLDPGNVGAAATIAARTRDPRTREAAILALGRCRADGAQDALVDLYDRIADPAERGLVIDQLRPADPDGAVADWMVGALGSPDVPAEHKRRIASGLVVAALPSDGGTGEVVAVLRDRVPAEWRSEIDARYRALTAR